VAGWIEQRFLLAEQRLEMLYRWILDLRNQLRAVQQGLIAAQQQGNGGGQNGGAFDGWYCTTPSSGSWGATWASGVPVSCGTFTAVVFYISGTTITNLGSQTVNNWFPASPKVGLVVKVFPDNSGAYQTGPQSCT
jgi:hypothetical protein